MSDVGSTDIGEKEHTKSVTAAPPETRDDYLVLIEGYRTEDLYAEFSADNGETWHKAAICPGSTIDQWRSTPVDAWNRSVMEGLLAKGGIDCVWNHTFDLPAYTGTALLRLKRESRTTPVLQVPVSLPGPENVFTIDFSNAVRLAGGKLSTPWLLREGSGVGDEKPVLFGEVESQQYHTEYPAAFVHNAGLPPLILRPELSGWWSIYIGMEAPSSCRLSLSGQRVIFPVPSEKNDELRKREYYVTSADITGQDIHLYRGGTRVWCDSRISYIRFTRMSDSQIERFTKCRRMAAKKGRPFAGYTEPVTKCYYEGETISLRNYLQNEMKLHAYRGCTDVYVHALRVGTNAWYHSDVVDRSVPGGKETEEKDRAQLKWTEWMNQGDPIEVAVEEARRAGLKVFADMGMNITYLGTDRYHYGSMTVSFAKDHPEYACRDAGSYFDYRHREVQDYAVMIAGELMAKYPLDGLNLDFARFACNKAFDEASLIRVMRLIDDERRKAAEKHNRKVALSVRIPSYIYHEWEQYSGDYPEFVNALSEWAGNGWIERAMVCCMLPKRMHELSLERYSRALAGADVELWGDLYVVMPGMREEYFLDIARKWCLEGLNGGFFLYEPGRPVELGEINWKLRCLT